VVAYSVTLRTAEIGVRLALGATAARLVRQFVAEHLLIVFGGAVVGWLLAFAVVVAIFSAPVDVVVFAGVPIVLVPRRRRRRMVARKTSDAGGPAHRPAS
jgi:ABC-type antimicrobial peptide transport system permease subunit